MEIRTFHTRSLFTVLVLSVVLGSSFSRDPAQQADSTGHKEVKPVFDAEPEDRYVLPNSPAPLLCKAKFVSKLNFSCTGGLVPKEIYRHQNDRNVTTLLADVTHVMIKANALDGVSCVCLATGYSGVVLKSRSAAVTIAYLKNNFIISPSRGIRVPKNSLVALRCQPPTGKPSPTVSWQKDGNPVDTHRDGRVEVTNHSNLSLVLIRKAQTSDAGYYTCVASNLVGTRKSATIKLNVYVDGGWTAWREFSPCSAKCGNGTRMLKRFCSNPAPENGGQFCAGPSFKIEPCQDTCPDLEIICPNHTNVYVNRSDVAFKTVSWSKPQVINRKNGTKFTVKVLPPWTEPPVEIPVNLSTKVYIITYVVKNEFGQMASCSFNITVYNGSSSACLSPNCKTETVPISKPPPGKTDTPNEGKTIGPIVIGLIVAAIVVLLLGSVALVSRYMRLRHNFESTKDFQDEIAIELHEGSYKRATLDSMSPLITHSASFSECGPTLYEKLRAVSPTIEEDFDLRLSPLKQPLEETTDVVETEVEKHAGETEAVNERKRNRERDYNRTNSSVSNKSTASEISRMMWSISNLPENADPKMVAWGLVDHNGGKFTIGDTGVSLSVPPQAIPEGHTEGIFIAIMNQEKEHPQVTSKESLLSPVVKCGPNGLKFDRPVILSMPHCALLEEGAWNLKVQYNESDPGTPADWKQLIDVNKQDGSEPYLAVVESNMVHLMVDHFTDFAVTGEPTATEEQAKKTVRIVAYVTPPEAGGDCVVRVYCVGDTPVHLESVHSQETERLGGVTRDAPKPFHFRDGGGDLLVKLTGHHPGWTNTSGGQKKIRFQHIWEGIERMPSCTFVFTLAGKSVPQFRATFEVKQDCQDGDEQEVIVSTPVKQNRPRPSETSHSSNKATEQTCTCADSASVPKAASVHSLEDATAAVVSPGLSSNPWKSLTQVDVLLGTYAGSPAGSPLQLQHTSSGYFSFGFEPLPSTDSLTRRIRNELILALDPPHPTADWRTLAENLGFEMKHIRWLENQRPPASPTDTLLTVLESQKYPLYKLTEQLHEMGRDDAASLLEAKLMLRETQV